MRYQIYEAKSVKYDAQQRVGVMLRRFDDLAEAGRVQLSWDFMFSTDPVYLSDGYRVQFVQFVYSNEREEIDELSVEPANMGNG